MQKPVMKKGTFSNMSRRDASRRLSIVRRRSGQQSSSNIAAGTVTIGATTTHATVAASKEVAAAIPALADLAGKIGDRQVRNRGTIGGSLANNDPAACYPAAVLALNPSCATVSQDAAELVATAINAGVVPTLGAASVSAVGAAAK